ncbi:GNAT family N-acetyltransferase [Neolewinella aurantiaca]|uniref:GNAT family N-acetyltransferase n=1 Tax=Neolewinella aurantiaca TaxID=2602767 RepID=A0A5C7FL55_9BACT|nr:GNAT family N-acetyltransferase [Neolewinella aurantiaca]TXF90731.1 GNAT family N-acetyltransferase [Neolewinella aurantiaca]
MNFRPARESDFLHLETFVWQAIFPAFDQPDLSAAQRAENDALVETARQAVLTALDERDSAVFVAIDSKTRALAGFIIVDAAPMAYAEIRLLIVKRSFWGKGVAEKLLDEATNFIGDDRAVSLAVRHYNGRAIAFFKKHGFSDTGETTGNFAISRTLMLREAYEAAETPIMEDENKTGYADDFPSSANEPVFEALPDYRLATDEAPLYQTGENKLSAAAPEERLFPETTLDEKTLTELEAFIARARALKGTSAPADGFSPVSPGLKVKTTKPASNPEPAAPPIPKSGQVYSPRDIPFEVDFGDGKVEGASEIRSAKEPIEEPAAKVSPRPKPSFEFAFETTVPSSETKVQESTATESAMEEPVALAVSESEPEATVAPQGRKTKDCPDCSTVLPFAARFCFSCGYPQPEEEELPTAGAQAPEEDVLILEELPSAVDGPEATDSEADDEKDFFRFENSAGSVGNDEQIGNSEQQKTAHETRQSTSGSGAISTKKYTMAELRLAFREHFQERVVAYFGANRLKDYYRALEESNSFQQLRDGSLTNLLNWINGGERTYAAVARRINDTMADLTEYFIVETAGDLSGNILPQRLLRHQSVDWDSVNLFKLIMDYLDFEAETERVYTDFVSMPARALRNATNAFLSAGKDERIFFICDQSLISQAKNGFAVTDAGVYWKNVLQPAGSSLFTTMEQLSLEQGYLQIDGQFFNAGTRLNLKMAVLLDKLRRMR